MLVARGIIDDFGVARNVFDLCGALQRRVFTGGEPNPVIGLDGLDCVMDPADAVGAVVAPLGMVAPVIVATRPITVPVARQRSRTELAQRSAASEDSEQVPITDVLSSPEAILDLDADQQQRIFGWQALEELLEDELGAAVPGGDPATVIAALKSRRSRPHGSAAIRVGQLAHRGGQQCVPGRIDGRPGRDRWRGRRRVGPNDRVPRDHACPGRQCARFA